ncbi:hypothetical protein HEAFMP_HEAFMP_04045, partial [Dysosmobacter welbionis]
SRGGVFCRLVVCCFGCGRHPPPLHEPPEPADGRDRQLRSHGDQRPQPDGDAKL